jgi:4-amino-4-deoxy-L-arabinose transferase-like glycosyltransferase
MTTVESPPVPARRRRDPLGAVASFARSDRGWALAVAAATLLALFLRLVSLRQVRLDPFYDAAVRSMGLSWHNFFFGAFDPSASASVDKPPLDLWLQVASVKVLGYKPIALKLPAALAGSLAVPLLYDLVRRFAGRAAGLLAAAALAVLPVSVLTARSDTMDSLMMALLVLCAWLIVRAGERRRLAPLIGAAVVLGLAFNTKLLEALIAAPALLVLAWLLPAAGSGSRRARAGQLASAGVAFVVVSLSWMTIVTLVPRRDRPFALGSTHGSVWESVFVFNGTDRLLKPAQPDTFSTPAGTALVAATRPAALAAAAPARRPAARRRRRATASQSPAGPLRLFEHSALDYGGLIGVLLLAAIAYGGLALAVLRPPLLARDGPGARRRVTREGAAIAALAVWLAVGYALFSFAGRTHQRYLEAFTPAVAAALGAGLVALAMRAREPRALAALLAATAATVLEVVAVTGTGSIQHAGEAAAVLLGLAVLVPAVGVLVRRRGGHAAPWWWLPGLVAAGTAAAVLAFPVARDVRLIRDHTSDEAASPPFSPVIANHLSRFLRAHQGGARYEAAVAAPSLAAPLIIRDLRPIQLLTTVNGRPLVGLSQLKSSVASGQVRYVLTRGTCPRPRNHRLPACSAAVQWVLAHGRDVSAQLHAGAPAGLLYELTPRSGA